MGLGTMGGEDNNDERVEFDDELEGLGWKEG
jgi:hypothetical protein